MILLYDRLPHPADRGSSLNIFLPGFSIACIIQGVLIAHINIPATTVMMRIVDKDKLSKVNSIVNIGSQGMIPIASVLAGAVLQSFGSTALLAGLHAGFHGYRRAAPCEQAGAGVLNPGSRKAAGRRCLSCRLLYAGGAVITFRLFPSDGSG